MDFKRVIIPLLLIMPFAVNGQEDRTGSPEIRLTDLPTQTYEKVGLKEEEKDDTILTPSKMYDKGRAAYDKKDYTEAAEWYRKAADQGFAGAQNNLGTMYHDGHGVSQDYNEAVVWYRKAAEQGLAAAECNLGNMYIRGYGVSRDNKEAVRWIRKAAEQDYPVGQYLLGYMYHGGLGVGQSYDKAVEWMLKAAEQGFAHAQYNLGLLYEYEEYDLRKAKKWYRKAAKQGHTKAINRLKELGVPVGKPQ